MKTESIQQATTSLETVKNLSGAVDYPRLSIYLPIHKHPGQTTQNQTRLEHCIKEARAWLEERGVTEEQMPKYIEPLQTLLHDPKLLKEPESAMGIFIDPNVQIICSLRNDWGDMIHVSNRFYTKPLLQELKHAESYYLLALNRKNTCLYEGGSGSLDHIAVPDLPVGITDVTWPDDTEEHLQGHAGATRSAEGRSGTAPDRIVHGQNTQQDYQSQQQERFIHAVANAIDKHLKNDSRPLVIIGDEYNIGQFFRFSEMPEDSVMSIHRDSNDMSLEELLRTAGESLHARHKEEHEEIRSRVEESPRENVTTQLKEIAIGAQTGRVDTCMLAVDGDIIAVCEPEKDSLRIMDDAMELEAHDVIDTIAQETLLHGGTVEVAQKDEIENDAVALLRY